MGTSIGETSRGHYYAPPTATIIIVRSQYSLLTVSGDDDNTGGTGHNMPWDD